MQLSVCNVQLAVCNVQITVCSHVQLSVCVYGVISLYVHSYQSVMCSYQSVMRND